MQPPLVYVLIINWNGREHLEACFQSLVASTYSNVVFLLVDNASTDSSVAYVEENFGNDGRVDILALPENRGWSGGNNVGILHAMDAGSDYIFLLNNDTAIAPDALDHLVARMESNPKLGALAPRMVLFDQPYLLNSVGLTLSMIGAAWDIGIGRVDGPQWHEAESVVGVCGGAMFLRASAVEKTGLLPEDFEIYLDDLDLCLRLWTAGYTIERCAEAVVQHKFSATMGTGARARYKYYLNTRNRFRILMRHFPVAKSHCIGPQVLIGEVRALGRALLSSAFWQVTAHVRAWCAALGYVRAALRFRQSQSHSGLPAFWPLVVSRPQFCPALVLPKNGWYPSIRLESSSVWPITKAAWVAIPEGTLQVLLVNCYPAGGITRIALYLDGSPLGQLETASQVGKEYRVEGGLLRVEAESLFPMEATGAPADVGAWLQLTLDGRVLSPTDELEPAHVSR